ncbi:SRPBCC domain-containing protein [Mesobacillus maritimus]|uniref:SRPBCC family protein n=1 Tax=Mesobacillus maritimus TaxID=1643336 RepID=UPI002042142B|nr:SRPBCC domain-containing protein [Mesobacillus maritimus]MCM3669221.1 SRPBCC domain-containing protein [Mesobacillus maritimus]
MTDKHSNTVAKIEQTITINAAIQKVWEVVSTAEGIEAWFMPNNFEPKLGFEFELQSPFGPSPCKVLELDAPHLLSFSWDTEGWKVSFKLKELDGKTEFTLIHDGWKHPDEIVGKAGETSSVIRERMNQGWSGIVQKLKKVVEQ